MGLAVDDDGADSPSPPPPPAAAPAAPSWPGPRKKRQFDVASLLAPDPEEESPWPCHTLNRHLMAKYYQQACPPESCLPRVWARHLLPSSAILLSSLQHRSTVNFSKIHSLEPASRSSFPNNLFETFCLDKDETTIYKRFSRTRTCMRNSSHTTDLSVSCCVSKK